MPKTYATIYVDEETIKKAKEIGLNISKVCENCLKEATKRLGTPSSQTMPNREVGDQHQDIAKQWWTGRDLNPRPRRCQRRDHSKLIYPPNSETVQENY